MIAALPMYDRPETAGANDRLWGQISSAFSDHGIHAPGELTRGEDVWDVWLSPNLCLAQTCGLPFRWRLHDKVSLVATPIHPVSKTPGFYHSVLVAQAGDDRGIDAFDGATIAVNEGRSQSGWAAPVAFFDARKLQIGRVTLSGAHINSARMVATGRADIAALDVVSWNLIQRYDVFAKDLRVVAETDETPALPYITSLTQDHATMATAMADAIGALCVDDRETLLLDGVTQIPAECYLAVTTPEPPQAENGD